MIFVTGNRHQPQQQNSAMVMLLSGSWQPDRQYNIGTKNTSVVAEPLRNQSGRSTSAMYEIRKTESTWSQLHKTSKNIEKLLLSKKLCVLDKITFFYVNPGFPCWPKIWQWYEAGTFKTRQSVPDLARHIYGDCQSYRRSPGPLGGSPILPLAGTTTGGSGGIVEPTGSVGLTGNDYIYAVQGPVHFVWF